VIVQSFKMAVKAITSNKVRSILTMLGVIIGVLSITVLVSLVSSTTDEVTGQIEDLGSNMLIANVTSDRYEPLTLKEIETLSGQPGIMSVCPSLTGQVTAKAGTNDYDTQAEGTTSMSRLIRKWDVQEGRFLMKPDIDNATPVAIIGVNAADEIFGKHEEVTGKTFTLNGVKVSVAGVLEEQGSSMMGSDDDKIIIPFTFAQRLFSTNGIKAFYVSATSSVTVDLAEETLKSFMMQHYRSDEDAFRIFSQSSILDMMSTVTGLLTTLLGGIAAISLLVGGIGIMNIMLVSVSERTREIGIRKAIGASRRNILLQFLIEALVISLLGGLIGIGISYLALTILSQVMDMSIVISAGIVAISLGFSIGVGLVFGMYPANKASKLHPIEALRYEG
jgi:putative ABC transport system permease protein